MSDKQFFYLCGLPRAGNTLLSSLLNQNPDLKLTANSITGGILTVVDRLKTSLVYQNFPDERSLDNVIKNIMNNYYSHWDCKYIIDRGVWGLPNNLELLKKYNKDDIKIIVLVRDIKEILASFIKWSYSNETNFIAQNSNTIRQRCDYVMQNGGELHTWIQAVYNITKPQNRKYIHLIEYNDLVDNTYEELDKIYEYLNIPRFEHKLTGLEQLKINDIQYNDDILGGNLHTINTEKVIKQNYDIKNYLPNNVDLLYKLEPFWRRECLI